MSRPSLHVGRSSDFNQYFSSGSLRLSEPSARATKPTVNVTRAFLLAAFSACACALPSAAQETAPARVFSSIAEIRGLSQAEAAHAYRTQHQATVLIYDYRARAVPPRHELLVYDGKAGLQVAYAGKPLELRAGDRIEVLGHTEAGPFAPIVRANKVARLGPGVLPPVHVVAIKDVLSGREDGQWVELAGVVRRSSVAEDRLEMVLDSGGTRFPVSFTGPVPAPAEFQSLVEARVTVRGVATGLFNEQSQMTGVRCFYSPGLEYLNVLRPSPGDPFARPARTFAELRTKLPESADDLRVKVAGTVAYDWRGHAVFLTDGVRSLQVKCVAPESLAVGDAVEAIGFCETKNFGPCLQDGACRRIGTGTLPPAREVDAAAALSGAHEACLVTLRAQLISQVREGGEEVLLLDSGGTPFTARLPSLAGSLRGLRAGDAVKVTGICTSEDLLPNLAKHGWHAGEFQLLLRTPGDVRALSWWTRPRLLTLGGAIVGGLVASLAWVAALRRRVRAQMATIQEKIHQTAALEERNRIARELHDTLAQGFAGTAFALEGVATHLEAGDHRIRPQIEMALRMVRHSLTEARRSVMNLRAHSLENRGLASALEETARKLTVGHEIELKTDIQSPARPLAPRSESEVFRIGVEAITNALRHTKPRVIKVALKDAAGGLLLRVSDDGAGFDAAAAPAAGHFGLIGMRERARHLNAELAIESTPGSGCEVRLLVPHPGSGVLAAPPTKA